MPIGGVGLGRVVCEAFSHNLFHDIISTPMWDCIYCGEECSNKERKRIHIQQECKERPEWNLSCIFCGREFRRSSQLIVHKTRWCKEMFKK